MPRACTPLGHAGIGIAGDVFDYRIIDRAIAPLLGKGDTYRIMGKPLPVPPEYYSGFARWHRLSLMRTPRTLRAIAEVARTAQHPERLHHLIALIEDGLGYALYQAVSTAKAELSSAETTMLRFRHKDFVVERAGRRAPSSKAGSPPTLRASPPRSIRCWRRPTCRRTRWIECSSPAAPRSSPPSAGCSKTASARTGWPAAASSSRWPRALR